MKSYLLFVSSKEASDCLTDISWRMLLETTYIHMNIK
jgi:hypothetical protein